MENDIKATAYHEAGHAVVAHVCGRRFKSITIEPKDNTAGSVKFYDKLAVLRIIDGTHPSDWLSLHKDEAERIVDRHIFSAMAGHIAQEMAFPGSVEPWQWENDREDLLDILIASDPDSGWDRAKAEAEALLSSNWHLVERLAEALLSRRTLTGKEARAILLGEPRAGR